MRQRHRKSSAPATAVATIATSGACQPPEDSARLPQTLPATETPRYEKRDMNPIDVPAKRFVEMFVAVVVESVLGMGTVHHVVRVRALKLAVKEVGIQSLGGGDD